MPDTAAVGLVRTELTMGYSDIVCVCDKLDKNAFSQVERWWKGRWSRKGFKTVKVTIGMLMGKMLQEKGRMTGVPLG